MYIYIYIHIHACMYVCMYIYIYTHMYVCMYVCMYECMYIYIYIYIFFYTHSTTSIDYQDDSVPDFLRLRNVPSGLIGGPRPNHLSLLNNGHSNYNISATIVILLYVLYIYIYSMISNMIIISSIILLA